MSNKSAEAPEGILNQQVLKSFMSISGTNTKVLLQSIPIFAAVQSDVISPCGSSAKSASPITGTSATPPTSTPSPTSWQTSSTSRKSTPKPLGSAATPVKSTHTTTSRSPSSPTALTPRIRLWPTRCVLVLNFSSPICPPLRAFRSSNWLRWLRYCKQRLLRSIVLLLAAWRSTRCRDVLVLRNMEGLRRRKHLVLFPISSVPF